MIKIIDIHSGSIAEELGIRPGDILISINGQPLNDRLDYRFYVSEENVELLIRRGDDEALYEIEKDADDQLGIIPEEMHLKSCGNNCLFCFVPQNPKGMRKALYFKDEDYRYSFLYGHYVTMTTLKQSELQRIVEQRLSPLYVSVHSTETKTRQYLLGIKRDDHLLEKIEYLTANGIELHAQIVLCPGINDGAILEKTVQDLSAFYPAVKSIAVVPLGLTEHREHLPKLRLHKPEELKRTIRHVDVLRAIYKKKLGIHFVYLADEFFIKSQYPIPPAAYYDEFYQIENGVGEFREMVDRFKTLWPERPTGLKRPVKMTLVTGTLAAGLLKNSILAKLRQTENLFIEMVPVLNYFYGLSIQVSGLLVGHDIFTQLKGRNLGEIVLLPPRVLNEDGLFLDDWTIHDLENKLGAPCYVYTQELAKLPQVVQTMLRRKAG